MPSDSKIVECPAEGCDYEGLATSVASHYQAKTDGAHPGSRQKALRLLEGSASEAEPEPKQSVEQSTSTASGSASSNPTFGGADATVEPEPEPTPTEPSKDASELEEKEGEKVCLKCSGALWDFRQFEIGAYHMVNGHPVWVRGDFQCSECGEWWVDE